MLATPHLLVGGVCGILSSNPVYAFTAGFLSHILLDLLPHHDHESYLCAHRDRRMMVASCITDFFLGVILLAFFLQPRPHEKIVLGMWGAFGGFFIDIVDNFIGAWLWRGFRRTYIGRAIHIFHEACHVNTPKSRWILSLVTQTVSSFGSLFALYYL